MSANNRLYNVEKKRIWLPVALPAKNEPGRTMCQVTVKVDADFGFVLAQLN